MLKIFILIIIAIVAFLLWQWVLKHKNNSALKPQQAISDKLRDPLQPKLKDQDIEIEIINEEDQRRFDDVAQLMFEKAMIKKDIACAELIQNEYLNKMPTQAQSQIDSFDLGDWSIYWNYKDQSLEYYVGRYGVFYTHVDRNRVEHKVEFKDQSSL